MSYFNRNMTVMSLIPRLMGTPICDLFTSRCLGWFELSQCCQFNLCQCLREVVAIAAWTTAVFVFHVSLDSLMYYCVPMLGVRIYLKSALWPGLFVFLLLPMPNESSHSRVWRPVLGDSPFWLGHSHTGSYYLLIVRLVAIWRTCDRSAMFATIHRSGRILRSVFFAGGRSSYDWSYAWSRDQQRLEKIDSNIYHIVGNCTTSGSHKRSIVRSIVAPDDRSYDQSRNSATKTSQHFIMSVSNRLVVPPVVRWHDQFEHDHRTCCD